MGVGHTVRFEGVEVARGDFAAGEAWCPRKEVADRGGLVVVDESGEDRVVSFLGGVWRFVHVGSYLSTRVDVKAEGGLAVERA